MQWFLEFDFCEMFAWCFDLPVLPKGFYFKFILAFDLLYYFQKYLFAEEERMDNASFRSNVVIHFISASYAY